MFVSPPSLLSAGFTGSTVVFAGAGSSSSAASPCLLHPSSNRVVLTDLATARTCTLPFQSRSSLSLLAASPSPSPCLFAVDVDGYSALVNLATGAVVARINLHSSAVSTAVFSPDGSLLAVAVEKKLFLYLVPSEKTNFQFLPLKTFQGHAAPLTHLHFPAFSSLHLLSAASDGSVRLWDLSHLFDARPASPPQHAVFTDQIHAVVGAFMLDSANLVSLSRTAFLVHYSRAGAAAGGQWAVAAKAQLRLPDGQAAAAASGGSAVANVTGVAFHATPAAAGAAAGAAGGLLAVGFSSGVFALYELPSLSALQCFSLSAAAVPRTLALGGAGEWVGLGLANGSVAVYEWKSESFVLRTGGALAQSGGVSCVACVPRATGALGCAGASVVAVGGWNGELRLYEEQSGFNFATFAHHTAAVTAVAFLAGARAGGETALVSASLDGSIRAYDLRKLRNFRTFTRPAGAEGAGEGWRLVAVDEVGEVVAGASGSGGSDLGGIWLWSMKTGQVLERLAGHESVVTGLGFTGRGSLVSTSLTDRSVRVWKYMEGGAPETTVLARDAVAMSVGAPETGEVAIATTAGKLVLYADGKVSMEIDCGRDIVHGRTSDSLVASNKYRGKKFSVQGTRKGASASGGSGEGGSFFGSIAWVGSKSVLVAVSRDSPYVYLYDMKSGMLLNRMQICSNRAVDGILPFLNAKLDTRGAADGLAADNFEKLTGLERKKRRMEEEATLPGLRAKHKAVWQAWQVASSPDGSALAVATSEGAFVFHSEHTQRDKLLFRPAVIDADVNLQKIDQLFAMYDQNTDNSDALAKALATSLALNHEASISKAVGKIPVSEVSQYISLCVASELLQSLVFFLANALQPGSVRNDVELLMRWADALMSNHWRDLQQLCAKNSSLLAAMQNLILALNSLMNHLGGLLKKNAATLEFLVDAASARA